MTDSNNSPLYMPVAPAYGYGYGNSGNNGGLFGGSDIWGIILVLLLLGGGMWGGLGGGLGGMMWPMMMGGMGAGMGLDYLYPWLNNSEHISDGFRDQALQTSINGLQNSVTTGFSGVQQSLCSGFAGVNSTVNGAQNAIAQQLYGNEIASLNRSFAEQTANAQGFNGVQNQLAQCCCDNRLATCQTQNLIQADGEATRNAILTGVQSIKDQLCQDKIDAKNDEIAQLRQTIAMKDLAASQTAQNAFIAQGFSNEVDQLYNRLNSCPVPTTPVYGRTPIFTCGGNNVGCGCGGNTFMN